MNQLFFKLENLSFIIFPDTQAHLNGHAVITYTYSLYKATEDTDTATITKWASKQHLVNNNDPDYFGQITFEVPDKLFTYAGGVINKLDADQIEQIIEFLSDIRSNSNLWALDDLSR